MTRKIIWLWVGLVLGGVGVHGQVVVRKPSAEKIGLDISGFTAVGTSAARVFRQTLENNLKMSGHFELRSGGVAVLQGSVGESGANVTVAGRVTGVADQRIYYNKGYTDRAENARRLARLVADEIIEALTGKKGFLSASIALVGIPDGRNKELFLCAMDGSELRQLTADKTINITPQWAPDGKTLYYTSYIRSFPDLYRYELTSGRRARVAAFPGLNTGGAVSPDGRWLALILSKDGNPELYVMGVTGGAPVRLTQTPRASEASPVWSPDGRFIAYVSDVSGSPQIWVTSRDGTPPRRMTSRGSQNVSPDWGPSNLIAYASLQGGQFRICVMDPTNLEFKEVSPPGFEDPSWAPDGRHLVAVGMHGASSAIYLLDVMGSSPLCLLSGPSKWTQPAVSRN